MSVPKKIYDVKSLKTKKATNRPIAVNHLSMGDLKQALAALNKAVEDLRMMEGELGTLSPAQIKKSLEEALSAESRYSFALISGLSQSARRFKMAYEMMKDSEFKKAISPIIPKLVQSGTQSIYTPAHFATAYPGLALLGKAVSLSSKPCSPAALYFPSMASLNMVPVLQQWHKSSDEDFFNNTIKVRPGAQKTPWDEKWYAIKSNDQHPWYLPIRGPLLDKKSYTAGIDAIDVCFSFDSSNKLTLLTKTGVTNKESLLQFSEPLHPQFMVFYFWMVNLYSAGFQNCLHAPANQKDCITALLGALLLSTPDVFSHMISLMPSRWDVKYQDFNNLAHVIVSRIVPNSFRVNLPDIWGHPLQRSELLLMDLKTKEDSLLLEGDPSKISDFKRVGMRVLMKGLESGDFSDFDTIPIIDDALKITAAMVVQPSLITDVEVSMDSGAVTASGMIASMASELTPPTPSLDAEVKALVLPGIEFTDLKPITSYSSSSSSSSSSTSSSSSGMPSGSSSSKLGGGAPVKPEKKSATALCRLLYGDGNETMEVKDGIPEMKTFGEVSQNGFKTWANRIATEVKKRTDKTEKEALLKQAADMMRIYQIAYYPSSLASVDEIDNFTSAAAAPVKANIAIDVESLLPGLGTGIVYVGETAIKTIPASRQVVKS